jgi:hypothetical protein
MVKGSVLHIEQKGALLAKSEEGRYHARKGGVDMLKH